MQSHPWESLREFLAFTLQFVLAAVCIMASVGKLLGYETSLTTLEGIGLNGYQGAIIGVIEVAAGILLILPQTARYGAILLAALMVSANRLFIFSTSEAAPAFSLVILALCLILALIRWHTRADPAITR
ncbi:MAG: DoxX family protein [Pseudomonadota bacterium]